MNTHHRRHRRAPRYAAALLLSSAAAAAAAVTLVSIDNSPRRTADSNSNTKPKQSEINLQRPTGRLLSLPPKRFSDGIRRIFYGDATRPHENGKSSRRKTNESRRLLSSKTNQREIRRRLIHDFTKFESSHRLLGGAFNPNLENFDPHGDPTNGVGGVGAVGIVDNDLAIEA